VGRGCRRPLTTSAVSPPPSPPSCPGPSAWSRRLTSSSVAIARLYSSGKVSVSSGAGEPRLPRRPGSTGSAAPRDGGRGTRPLEHLEHVALEHRDTIEALHRQPLDVPGPRATSPSSAAGSRRGRSRSGTNVRPPRSTKSAGRPSRSTT
jgi:hypothetical protein